MNEDDQIKRLKRIIVRQNMLFMLILVGIVVFFSYQAKQLNNAISLASNKKPVVIHGIDGKQGEAGLNGLNGLSGINGVSGLNGRDGQDVTVDQVLDTVNKALPLAISQYFTQNPVQTVAGKDGQNGKDGATPTIWVDSSCRLLTSYSSDDTPVLLLQLPLPCGKQ